MDYVSPLERFYHWESSRPDKVFLRQPINDIWVSWTWKQAGDEVRRMAAALKAIQLPPASHIALISKNCAHWVLCDLAIMMSGHISIPLYPNLHAETLEQILEHSGAKILFVGKLDDWASMKPGVPLSVRCISFPYYAHSEYENWGDLIKQYPPLQEQVKRNASERSTIIYTSGTTGQPKGVMHNFNSLSFVLQHAIIHLELDHEPKYFSYLPLSHIAERLLVEMGCIYTGGELYFTESLEKFAKNLFEVQPTVFFAVHRIWKKFQEGILAKLPQSRLNILLRIPILSAIVRKKIKKQLGLSKATNIFTGASPTPVELIQWFATLGINIQEAYGLTENCIYSTTTLKNHIKPGFAGQRFPNCEVIISENNEILIKHEALMEGYYKDPQLSAEAFTSKGFLRTGDEGYFDEDGFLKITGRLKELFKTSKGKYVAPSPIEMKISGSVLIEWVCVIGSGQPQPMAMILLSTVAKQKPRAALETELHQLLHTVNASVDASEHLSKFILLSDEWSVENGLLTPSFKIKRNLLEKKYESQYDQWYAHTGTLVWVS